MHTTSSLLDAYKARFGITSDNRLAIAFGITRQRIAQYRRGDSGLCDDRAILIARELNLDPGVVLVSLQAERAQKAANSDTFDALSALLRRVSGAMAVIVAVFVFLPSGDAYAFTRPAFDNNVNYAKQPRHRPRWRWLASMLASCLRTACILVFCRATQKA